MGELIMYMHQTLNGLKFLRIFIQQSKADEYSRGNETGIVFSIERIYLEYLRGFISGFLGVIITLGHALLLFTQYKGYSVMR